MTPDWKLKLLDFIISTATYWAPALFVALCSALAYILPKLANWLRDKSPYAAVDEGITLIENFILALIHSKMDEAEAIKKDPALTPAQKLSKLEALAQGVEKETAVYADKVFGDQMKKVLGENPVLFIRGLVEKLLREVKARFFAGK